MASNPAGRIQLGERRVAVLKFHFFFLQTLILELNTNNRYRMQSSSTPLTYLLLGTRESRILPWKRDKSSEGMASQLTASLETWNAQRGANTIFFMF